MFSVRFSGGSPPSPPSSPSSSSASSETLSLTPRPDSPAVSTTSTDTLSDVEEDNQIGLGRLGIRTFRLIEESFRYLERYEADVRDMVIKILPPPENSNPIIWLERAMHDLHTYLTVRYRDCDFIGISVRSDNFSRGDAGLSFRPIYDFTAEDLWGVIGSVCQSNEDFQLDESFTVTATHVVNIDGEGGTRKRLAADELGKRSIITIENNDNLCLPRALIVGEHYLAKKKSTRADVIAAYESIRKKTSNVQRVMALRLTQAAGVQIGERGCGIPEIEKFQEYYAQRGIAIVMYEYNLFGRGEGPSYNGCAILERNRRRVEGVINLMYHRTGKRDGGNQGENDDIESTVGHFNLITNVIAAYGSNYFCIRCNVGYAEINKHDCPGICDRCYKIPACPLNGVNIMKCLTCNREFYGMACLQSHLRIIKDNPRATRTVCQSVKVCNECCKIVNIAHGQHRCGEIWCRGCSSSHARNEYCYMNPIKEKKNKNKKNKTLFIFYDFETRQDEPFLDHPTTKVHVVNLCVANQVCTDCLDDDNIVENRCQTCGVREHIFRATDQDDPIKRLIDLCVRRKKKNDIFGQIVCIAHNSKAFDAQFVLKRIIEEKECIPSVILKGKNIILIECEKTKFIDSINYLPMRLSALPKAFDLPESTKKGYFPHLFNTLQNQNYIGPLPAVMYYSPDSMSEKERSDFLSWHEETRLNYVFDFNKEIIEYCKMDIQILRRACLKFRQLVIATGKVCPFTEACTLASTCSRVFRKNFLKEKTIGILPPQGYRRAGQFSQKAIEWLLQCERVIGREIIHAGRAREYRLREGLLVDGYLEPEGDNVKGVVFEFHGCYYHGCPVCFKNNRDRETALGKSFDQLYEQTQRKMARMVSAGYDVRIMWECSWDRLKATTPSLIEFLNRHPLLSKVTINPRDALSGGRTENIILRYNAGVGEKINYYDVTSMYPHVCKRGVFPVGHPTIYIGTECDVLTGGDKNNLNDVNGLVKCMILPPRNLYLPLLGQKCNGRLIFGLCRSCCEEARQGDCNHENSRERALTGTWIAEELRKAVELGYRVLEIYVIWEYVMTSFNQHTGEGGLFAGYVNTFLKLKQEASGWPEHCVDEESKQSYIDRYLESEGIALNRDNIEKNPGMRALAKLFLNSLWGKLAQRSNMKQTHVIQTREDLLNLLTHPDKRVLNVLAANDHVLYVNWENVEAAIAPAPNTNVVVASYVTAQGRLMLYDIMEPLGNRCLYFDTDSCVFLSREHDVDPELGTLLGELTNELEGYGPGAYIKKFVTGGPKFYAYVVQKADGSESKVVKVKGIRLNYENSQKINFESIENLVIHALDDTGADVVNDFVENGLRNIGDEEPSNFRIKLKFRAIRRTNLHDVDETKTCCVVLKKRRYLTDTFSLPYGYKQT